MLPVSVSVPTLAVTETALVAVWPVKVRVPRTTVVGAERNHGCATG